MLLQLFTILDVHAVIYQIISVKFFLNIVLGILLKIFVIHIILHVHQEILSKVVKLQNVFGKILNVKNSQNVLIMTNMIVRYIKIA